MSARYGWAMSQSKYSFMFNPPLSVTLNLPSLGLITATKVGRKMYQASTDSYTSAQNECLNSPCMRELVKLACSKCGSA